MRVLVAPDKFKGSLTAREVASHIAAGIRDSGGECVQMPLADGGDGSVEAALAAGWSRVPVRVPDALGRPHRASFAFDGTTAVVEIANTCGLDLLGGHPDPMGASSAGLGHALLAALEHNPTRVVIAAGGSSSTDGGAGFLSALGVMFEDEMGRGFVPAGGSLHRVHRVRWTVSDALRGVELLVATDVRNPLFGPTGAAHVYGAQKGASEVQKDDLDLGLRHLVKQIGSAARPDAIDVAVGEGAGSAGGVGFAARLIGARQVSGARFFLDLLGFDAACADVDLVVTGEGALDAQTGQGKLVEEVARRAAPTLVVAAVGRSDLVAEDWAGLGLREVYVVSDRAGRATSDDPELTGRVLELIGAEIGGALGRLPG